MNIVRDGPLDNLWGGGRSTKKKFAPGKIKGKKILARQLTLKIFMLWPKKNSYKEFANEKKFLRLENSPPPITFLMVCPLPGENTIYSMTTQTGALGGSDYPITMFFENKTFLSFLQMDQ